MWTTDMCYITSTEVIMTTEDIISKYKGVFHGLGCLPGEKHLEADCAAPLKACVAATKTECLFHWRKRLQRPYIQWTMQTLSRKSSEPTPWISKMVCHSKNRINYEYTCTPVQSTKALLRSHFEMATIEDSKILHKISNTKVFSVLNDKDGYWQVKLDEVGIYLTTSWTGSIRLI